MREQGEATAEMVHEAARQVGWTVSEVVNQTLFGCHESGCEIVNQPGGPDTQSVDDGPSFSAWADICSDTYHSFVRALDDQCEVPNRMATYMIAGVVGLIFFSFLACAIKRRCDRQRAGYLPIGEGDSASPSFGNKPLSTDI